jgi:hypothetical protein
MPRGRGNEGVRDRRRAEGWVSIAEAAERRQRSIATMHARTRTGELPFEVEAGEKFARLEHVDRLTFRAHGPHGETLLVPCAIVGCDEKVKRMASERARVPSGLHFCADHQYSEEAREMNGGPLKGRERGPDRAPTARANRSRPKIPLWEPGGPYDVPGADGLTVRDRITAFGTDHAASYRPQGSRTDLEPDEPTVTYAERLDRAQQAGRGPDWRPSAKEGRKRQAAAMKHGPDGRFVSTSETPSERVPVDREQLVLNLDRQARRRAQPARKAQAPIREAIEAAIRDPSDTRTLGQLAEVEHTTEPYVRRIAADLERAGVEVARRPPGRPRKGTSAHPPASSL